MIKLFKQRAELISIDKILLALIVMFILGCSQPQIEYRDVNLCIKQECPACNTTNTTVINNTIEVPCVEQVNLNDSIYSRDYVLNLIRQIKRLERNQDKFWNNSECFEELNKTEIRLEEAEKALCLNWNHSWC